MPKTLAAKLLFISSQTRVSRRRWCFKHESRCCTSLRRCASQRNSRIAVRCVEWLRARIQWDTWSCLCRTHGLTPHFSAFLVSSRDIPPCTFNPTPAWTTSQCRNTYPLTKPIGSRSRPVGSRSHTSAPSPPSVASPLFKDKGSHAAFHRSHLSQRSTASFNCVRDITTIPVEIG